MRLNNYANKFNTLMQFFQAKQLHGLCLEQIIQMRGGKTLMDRYFRIGRSMEVISGPTTGLRLDSRLAH